MSLSVSSTGLHARLHPDDVLDFVMDEAVEVDEEVDGVALAAGNLVEKGAQARPERLEFEVGLEFVREDGVVGEGKFLGGVLDEEVEGIDRRQVGGELDLDLELVGLFRENEPRLEVALRVLLPVDEVGLRRDLERVVEDRRPAMGGGAQAHDLRPERNRLGVTVVSDVGERGVNGHDGCFLSVDSRNYPVLAEKCHEVSWQRKDQWRIGGQFPR